jgi:hypothetical protein
MKNSILFIVIAVLTAVTSLFAPWWVVAPIAFLVAFFGKMKAFAGFWVSFLAVFVTWWLTIYITDNGVVAELLGKLLTLPSWAAPLVASIIGGLVAGFFGLSGALFSYRKKSWVNG